MKLEKQKRYFHNHKSYMIASSLLPSVYPQKSMAPSYSSSHPLLLSLFTILSLSSATATTTKIPLSSFPSTPSHLQSDPIQTLISLSSSSLTRAHHLKYPKKTPPSPKIPLSAHSYGAYSVSLSFGTPPQSLPFIFDTGSSLVWFPCTSRYFCSNCSFPNVDPSKLPTFIPKQSSSSKIIGCQNPKCELVIGPNVKSKCQKCDVKTQNCTQSCPSYVIQYGSGITAGLLLSDTLNLPKKKVAGFIVGCSFLSIHQPAGIAGFGRGPESLPNQLGLKKFSYCLLSRRLDDSPVTSDLTLDFSSHSGDAKTDSVTYTPFRKNPLTENSAFKEYYYVNLRKIIVGGNAVKVPFKYLVPDEDGNGGTIIDSGSTFTFLENPVFEPVAKEFEKQMSNYTRAFALEARTGLRPCFDISKVQTVNFPELVFQFKGGAKLELPLTNYFALVSSSGQVCLTLVTDKVVGPQVVGVGPAIIFGAFQQQNLFVEYDLANARLGFRKQTCNNG